MRKFKRYLWYFILICSLVEIILFPSIENGLLCLLSIIVTFQFCTVINKRVFITHNFSFWAYFTLFAYRYLPIFGTLLDKNPVSIGFHSAWNVFISETITFSIATLAFYTTSHLYHPNTGLPVYFKKWGFFKRLDAQSYWIIGFLGLTVNIGLKFIHNIELAKILGTISIFQFAPLCLFFPSLTGFRYDKKNNIIKYILLLFIITLTSGSRQVLLYPICTFILLYLLNTVKSNQSLLGSMAPSKKLLLLFLVITTPIIFERLSLAMIASRTVVFDEKSSVIDIVNATIDNFNDSQKLEDIAQAMDINDPNKSTVDINYWDERYISNSFLNRYCNLRLTDQTLYRLQQVELNNPTMLDNFIRSNTILLFPTPILKLANINIDKTKYQYSPGDLLLSLSTGNPIFAANVVTSHVADGLATFGYFYFPIQFAIWVLMFSLIDSFIFVKRNGEVIYSIFGLVSIFTFFGLTRASAGCGHELYYCLRQYWNGIIGIFLIFYLLKIIRYKIS